MNGDRMPVTVIAEAGVNHDGSVETAFELVRAAKMAGADVVKFQHFRTETIVSAGAKTAAYQQANTGDTSQSELLRKLELSVVEFALVSDECRRQGIAFLCTAFDVDSAAELVALGMTFVKIPSGELDNLPLLRAYARFGLPILLSTGMGTLEEVRTAVGELARAGAKDVTVLQCTSLYPAPPESINLRAMTTMGRELRLPVGFSDHSLDDHATLGAVALGATVIEKHLTLDRTLPGPDHAASLDPAGFSNMVRRIREMELMLGSGLKQPVPDEIETARLVRRSWHTTRDLPAGHELGPSDVVLKRPASGLRPDADPVGSVLRVAIPGDTPILSADLLR